MKDRAARRKNNINKALRKQRIVQSHGFDWYNNLHAYSKNKIHCSCWMCRCGITAGNNSIERKKISDRSRIEAMEQELQTFDF